ncbi:MAG: hypothetical protein H5U40_13165, partial [Polyangiaceae bacterium]|nr:hypothetical protein [Polyangiaceae bacterium]
MNRFLLISLVFALAGCEEDGSPRLNTGVNPNTQINELSDEDAARVCEGVVQLANELVGPERQQWVYCTVVGIATDIAHFGECAPARDNCLENGAKPAVPLDLACEYAQFVPVGCDATIGQLEACANDLSAAADAALDAIDCGLVDDADARSRLAHKLRLAFDPENHEACANLAAECLGYLDLPNIDID